MLRHAGTVESAALTHCPRLCFRSSTLKPQTSTTERTCRAASTVYMHSGTLADIVWSYNHSLVPCDRSAFHQVCDIFMRWTAQFVSRKASVGTRWVLIERSTSGGENGRRGQAAERRRGVGVGVIVCVPMFQAVWLAQTQTSTATPICQNTATEAPFHLKVQCVRYGQNLSLKH